MIQWCWSVWRVIVWLKAILITPFIYIHLYPFILQPHTAAKVTSARKIVFSTISPDRDNCENLILLVVIPHTSCSLCSVAELGGGYSQGPHLNSFANWCSWALPRSTYTLLQKRINWKCSELKLILPSQGSKRASSVQSGDFPGEVPPSSDIMPTTT